MVRPMAKLPYVTLIIKNKTAEQWTKFSGILKEGQLGIETDTGKMKAGDGVNLWPALPYLYLTPEDVKKLDEELAERLGEMTGVRSITVGEDVLTGEVKLGRMALRDELTADELPQNLKDVAAPLRVFDSYLNFPTIGETQWVYYDTATGTSYRWAGNRYYATGTDMTQVEIISGGDSTPREEE